MGKFRIKISSTWLFDELVVFKYSTNGIFWKKIKCQRFDIFSKKSYMGTKIKNYIFAEEIISRFKTIEDVRKYEEEEKQLVIEFNKKFYERKKKERDEKKNIYKQFS
jgi:hypothetical protein